MIGFLKNHKYILIFHRGGRCCVLAQFQIVWQQIYFKWKFLPTFTVVLSTFSCQLGIFRILPPLRGAFEYIGKITAISLPSTTTAEEISTNHSTHSCPTFKKHFSTHYPSFSSSFQSLSVQSIHMRTDLCWSNYHDYGMMMMLMAMKNTSNLNMYQPRK